MKERETGRVCVCVCTSERGKERDKEKRNVYVVGREIKKKKYRETVCVWNNERE